MDIQNSINERIKNVMEYYNLSANALAKGLGVSSTAIYKTLDGQSEPNYQLLNKIKKKYPSVNGNWLLTGEGEMITSDAMPITEMLVSELKKEIAWQRGLIDKLSNNLSKHSGNSGSLRVLKVA